MLQCYIMVTLSRRQRDVLNFILSYRDEHGTLPSRRNIQAHFKWDSYNSAVDHMNRLIGKGYLDKHDNAVGYKIATL